ncbi:recombinase family protein [Rhizobium rhizogenes]|uniref:recombinase family protein n=1 Tax=Rhizobium rhizogenes TaxID=359 RepID=UPI00115DD961|nr:recombinase family protein [Rhizobium rhizogenes]NTF91703.1 recombinase family protein [Rhizobium rhizogenes]NTH23469.1 recombinase family protein [Rhizobium rhizogenes]TRB15183.1 recombinase family protein [Rhizobium rhizogenes]
MTRAGLYARYSDDKQSEASIEDQFRLCREHALREGWEIAGSYEDAAISGASTVLRRGIQRLIRDAQRGEFTIVVAEALDRISRDQADVATLYKHLKFAGVTIVTLAEGEISELHVGLKGTMNALFLKDLAMKTHRGLRGRVEKGKAGGGLCYGYKVVRKFDVNGEPIRGDREIIPHEADTIRRIFREFASGKSPKAIAIDLNNGGIPGPLGRAWGDTSIRGHVSRGTGILNNELYTGVLVWNRQRFLKDPSTGKRVSRPNPESQWIRTEVPHLKIVDDDLWNAARARQTQISALFGPNPANTREGRMKRLHLANRPTALLSGLLTCGCCGGKFGIIVPNRYACLNHHRRGTCENGHSITRDKIEARVLAGLKDRLVSAEAVAEAVRAYAEEMNRLNHDRRAQAATDQKALQKIERAIAGIMAAIEDGMYQPSMKARMDDLERQKVEIMARQQEAPADIPDVHPNIANLYRRRVERLTEALNDPDGGRQAAEALRSLIDDIVLTPGGKRGEVHATLCGELFGILDFVRSEESRSPGETMPAAIARPRNQPSQRTSPRPVAWQDQNLKGEARSSKARSDSPLDPPKQRTGQSLSPETSFFITQSM